MSLTVASLSGCAGFPDIHPHVIRLKDGKCGEYEIIRKSNACEIAYKFKEWHNIEKCEGFFALSAEDVGKLKAYQKSSCEKPKVTNGN